MRRSFLVRLCAVGVVVLAAAAAVEILTRLLGLAPPLNLQYPGMVEDPHLPFRPRPGASYTVTAASGEFSYPVQHNRFGLRDREHPLDPPAGRFRMIALGDSFTYGSGATFEQTYLRRLEVLLSRRPGTHPPIDIVKAGIPRYYPETERMLLEAYGLRFRPDLVLVGFTPNDITDTCLGLEAVVRDGSGYLKSSEAEALGPLGHGLFLRSHAARIVLGAWVRDRLARRYRLSWEDVFRDGGIHEVDWVGVEREFDRMLQLLRPRGTPLVIVVVPWRGPWDAASGYPARRLEKWAADRPLATVIDPLPAFRRAATAGERLHWQRDPHCTPAGYRVLAEAIVEELESRSLVP